MAAEFDDNAVSDDLFEAEDTLKEKYLTFHLAGEDYGVPIRFVIEIIGIQRITDVPGLPSYVKGVINLRGKVIPVMDVRSRFHLPARDYDERTCIIVVEIEATSVGLLVDEVREVVKIPAAQVEPPPQKSGSSTNYIQGVGKVGSDVKILLNVEVLLYGDRRHHKETLDI